MKPVLISLMCHPERLPEIKPRDFGERENCEVELNTTTGYANAVKKAIQQAIAEGRDLIIADTDGYHPAAEIEALSFIEDREFVKPYRANIGIQSRLFSILYSVVKRRQIKDVTGGMCRMSLEFMNSLPPLKSTDMTIHVEIMNWALKRGVRVYQCPYEAGIADRVNSKRTKYYQAKLMKTLFR